MAINKIQELCVFVPNKPFSSLLDMSQANFIFLKGLIQNFKKLKYGLWIKIVNH